MSRRERLDDLETGVKTGLKSALEQTWTGFPGIIVSFNAQAMTAVVQPSITRVRTNSDGSRVPMALPKLLDCPVIFPSGGGVTLTFPIAAGDECWVNIADRCIDAWWQQGGTQPPMTPRIHDLSDGFVTVGPRSQPRVIGSISATTAELRSDDGSTLIALDPSAKTTTITAPSGHMINANTSANGTVAATGNISTAEEVQATGNIQSGATVSAGANVAATGDVTSDSGANSLNAIAAEIPVLSSGITSALGAAASAATTANAASTSVAAVSSSLAALPQPGTNANSAGYLGIPQTVIAANHTLGLADLGTELFCTANLTVSIPVHTALAQTLGSFVKITAAHGVTVTVSITTDSLILVSSGSSGSRTITGRGYGIFSYETTGEWWSGGIGLT